MDRKLAAILAADVVGYSALMEADENGRSTMMKRSSLRCISQWYIPPRP
jgi:class 3 adenylate cyclase